MKKILKLTVLAAILLSLVGMMASCKKKDYETVTGTIIGSYSNGFATLLVQVDKKYPIGGAVGCFARNCMHISNEGTYQNVIQVQPEQPPTNWSEGESIIGKRISFSYREYQEEDCELFFCNRFGNAMCVPPAVPIYVITNYQILK